MTRRLFDDCKGYANEANALRKLTTELALIGRSLDDTRYFTVVTSKGRIVPVVQVGSEGGLIGLAHRGIAVV